MNRWDRQWFGPVAAIRPYLFQKCFMLMIAMDALVLMMERGARYGIDRFNVAHFRWLDSVHRLVWDSGVPSHHFYVCILALVSFFSFVLFLIGHRPWLMLWVTCLYSYAWSMSRLDSYLHHYMITLIMGCMVFFPFIDPRWLRDEAIREPEQSPANKGSKAKTANKQRLPQGGDAGASTIWRLATMLFVLAIGYRVLLSRAVGLTDVQRWLAMVACSLLLVGMVFFTRRKRKFTNGPMVSSWAYRLLGTTVGVIYIFTSIAKMDSEWCGGYTLQQVGTTADVLSPVEQIAVSTGISKAWFWSALATFVIPLELTLALSYLVASGQDEPQRKWLPRWCAFAWLLAIGLHLNNEMMNLVIQWFGYYMLFLATLFLMPASVLSTVGSLFYMPDAWCRDWCQQRLASMTNGQATVLLGVTSFVALFAIVLAGFFLSIVGGIVASCLVAGGMVIVLVFGMVQGWERKSLVVSCSTAGAALLMICTVAQCSMRFDYYYVRGKAYLEMGRYQESVGLLEQAAVFSAPGPRAASDLYVDLGLCYRQLNKAKAAEKSYRRAMAENPADFLPHYQLANLMNSQDRNEDAELHYREAIRIKSDFSDAWINLGNLLEFKGRTSDAIACYEKAMQIEPDAADIPQMLERARESQ